MNQLISNLFSVSAVPYSTSVGYTLLFIYIVLGASGWFLGAFGKRQGLNRWFLRWVEEWQISSILWASSGLVLLFFVQQGVQVLGIRLWTSLLWLYIFWRLVRLYRRYQYWQSKGQAEARAKEKLKYLGGSNAR